MPEIFTPTAADEKIKECIAGRRSFSMIAGAGSGKTTSLERALKYLSENEAHWLRQNGQKDFVHHVYESGDRSYLRSRRARRSLCCDNFA